LFRYLGTTRVGSS